MRIRLLLLVAAFAVPASGAAVVTLLAQDTSALPVVEVYKSPT